MKNTNAVLVAGDWHGDQKWAERVIRQARKAGYKTILHVGDLGVLWPSGGGPQTEDKFTRLLKRWLKEAGIVCIFVDGNHDVHPLLRASPRNQGGFGVISDQLLYSPRGHRFTLGGKRFASLGGAISPDRSRRVPLRSWWSEEAMTPEDVARLGDDPVDILITHEVPGGIHVESGLVYPLAEELAYESYQQRLLVLDAVKNTKPALVFSGHWHQRVTQRIEDSETTVHVLHMNGFEGNVVSLQLDTMQVTEFPVRPFY